MAKPLRPTGNCFSIGLIDGTLRIHASGPSLILPGLESCSLLNESIWRATGDRAHRRAAPTIGSGRVSTPGTLTSSSTTAARTWWSRSSTTPANRSQPHPSDWMPSQACWKKCWPGRARTSRHATPFRIAAMEYGPAKGINLDRHAGSEMQVSLPGRHGDVSEQLQVEQALPTGISQSLFPELRNQARSQQLFGHATRGD